MPAVPGATGASPLPKPKARKCTGSRKIRAGDTGPGGSAEMVESLLFKRLDGAIEPGKETGLVTDFTDLGDDTAP